MTAYENMTPEEQAIYTEARMTHGQRQQAAQDRTFIQHRLLIGFFLLIWAVTMIEPLLIG